MKSEENVSLSKSYQLCAAAYINDIEIVKTLLTEHVDIEATWEGMSPLYLATIKNNIEIVAELIKHNANVDCLNKAGETPLHVAAQLGYVEIMEKLISSGANINAVTFTGRLPLFYAHATNNLNAANVLLKRGSFFDLSMKWLDIQLLKYLDFFIDFHPEKYEEVYLSLIKQHLEKGLCYGYTKLHRLMTDGKREQELKEYLEKVSCWDQKLTTLKNNLELESVFEKLLFSVFHLHMSDEIYSKKKFNPLFNDHVIKDLDYSTYVRGFTFGFIFKIDELEKLLCMLLKKEATINFSAPNYLAESMHILSLKKSDSGVYEIFDSNASISSIKLSSISELMATLKLIINADNNIINAQISVDIKQATSDQLETYSEIKKIFSSELIRQRMKDNEINLQDKLGSTSIHAATHANDQETVFKLLENGATIQADKKSLRPIYLAAQSGYTEIIKKLLAYGDDVNSTFQNDSALIIAANLGHTEAVQILIENQATIDFIGKNGGTPLCFACQEGFYDIAEMLIKSGANVNFCIPYKNSITFEPRITSPLGIAMQNGHFDIVKLLLKNGANLPKGLRDAIAQIDTLMKQKNDYLDDNQTRAYRR